MRRFFLLLFIFLGFLKSPWIYGAQNEQQILDQIRLDQKIGQTVPLNLTFQNETGQTVKLSDYFGKRPVILTPVYYRCPMLCGMVLNGLVQSLKTLKFTPGKELEVVTFSIDPEETPSLAKKKKKEILARYGHSGITGWNFLTSTGKNSDSSQKLTEALGFHFIYDSHSRQFAHPSAIVILTPEGKISRYFSGVEYPGRDLKFSIMEASQKRLGSPMDQILLLCYHYDPATGRYGLTIMKILRIFGIFTVLALGGFIGISLKKEKNKSGAKL